MTTTATTIGTDTAHGLAARATAAARRYRSAHPDTFDARHTDWPQWTYRARMAHAIATALDVPADTVTVTDGLLDLVSYGAVPEMGAATAKPRCAGTSG